MTPLADVGIVEAEPDALLLAGFGQFGHRIAFEGGRVDDVEGRQLRAEHREAVVMLGGDDDVLAAGLFGQLDPLVGVELRRVELGGELFIFLHRDFLVELHPFAAAQLAVDSPVDEHAEAGLAPPLHPRILALRPAQLAGSFL